MWIVQKVVHICAFGSLKMVAMKRKRLYNLCCTMTLAYIMVGISHKVVLTIQLL